MITPSKSSRRPLKFKTVAELDAELDQLRAGKYKKMGQWSLHQACRHLALVIEGNLNPPSSDVPTPEEAAMKEKFFGMVMGEAGMPENLPIGNSALIPSEDCTEAEVEHLKAAFASFEKYPHKYIKVGRCGPVPVSELLPLHLAHCAHHLSFLIPNDSRRSLSYPDFDAVIADVENLRKGYVQVGNWTLPQICRHLTVATTNTAKPAVAPVTPEQAAVQAVKEQVIKTGKIPSGLAAPAVAVPPDDCSESDIETFIATAKKARDYAEPTAAHPRFGPLTLVEFKKMVLAHMAHHLSYLVPVAGN
jgi:Protein of unknown function (DUF1569)